LEWINKYQALVAACIAVLGVFFTAYIAMFNNNKNILIKTVTEERSKWRSEMRSLCSEFISTAYNTKNKFNDEKPNKLLKIKVEIKLRLNPSKDPEHHLDQTITTKIDNVIDYIQDERRIIHVNHLLNDLERSMQELIKQEWTKSKKEAKTGKTTK
jgi:hypothetical protein